MTQDIRARTRSGIVVGFKPTTGTRYRIELQRSTQTASTASSLWTKILVDPTSQGYSLVDELPLSTRTYYYKARQLGLGSSNSSYSLTVSAKPQKFPEIWQSVGLNINNLGNVEVLGGDLWLSSSKRPKIGQQLSTGTITKRMRVTAMGFQPRNSTYGYVLKTDVILQNSNLNSQIYLAPLTFPSGVIVRRLRSQMFRLSTADVARMNFQYASTNGTVTVVTSTTMTSTGWGTVTSSTLSHSVSTARGYSMRCELNPSAGSSDAAMLWGEVEFTVADYSQAV